VAARPNAGPKADIEADMLTREEFLEYLREALNHLYDAERLRRSPLATLFGLADRFDAAAALQRILIDAIAALKPPAGETQQSPAWQIYEPLFYRYVEQLSADEVAEQLGIGTRHLRRWQSAAQEALADRLWQQFELSRRYADTAAEGAAPSAGDANDTLTNSAAQLREELAWLKEISGTATADLAETLPPILDLAGKLAAQHGVSLDLALPPSLPRVGAVAVAVRQTLISLLSVVIPRAAGGRVSISVQQVGWNVEIRVACPQYQSGPQLPRRGETDSEADNLNMAQQVAEICGYGLRLAADARGFDAALVVPALEQIPVLAVDDSVDALQLLQRYAAGTRYRLITSKQAEEALELAAKFPPQIIVLDVMMPHVDGWEMLGRLRQHPLTADVPIIVCTILAQRDLAMLLGASDFLRKPFTRADFLAALDAGLGLSD
jgi:CheY-like chemotaxis protein